MDLGCRFSRRCFLRGAAAAPAMGLVPGLRGAEENRASPAALIAAMREGGKVIYMRHATTVQTQVDTGRLGDRAGQRNLSPEGIVLARQIGRAFRTLAIPLDEILASPVFRARDTAELAFGADRIRTTMDLVADDYAGGGVDTMLRATERLLRTPTRAGTNRLLIGHRTPLEMATKQSFPDTVLSEGSMAVFVPQGRGARLIGTLTGPQLIAAAGS